MNNRLALFVFGVMVLIAGCSAETKQKSLEFYSDQDCLSAKEKIALLKVPMLKSQALSFIGLDPKKMIYLGVGGSGQYGTITLIDFYMINKNYVVITKAFLSQTWNSSQRDWNIDQIIVGKPEDTDIGLFLNEKDLNFVKTTFKRNESGELSIVETAEGPSIGY